MDALDVRGSARIRFAEVYTAPSIFKFISEISMGGLKDGGPTIFEEEPMSVSASPDGAVSDATKGPLL